YTTSSSESAPPFISSALESIQQSLRGRTLVQMLEQVSLTLERLLSRGQAHDPIDVDEDMDDQRADEDEDGEEDDLLSTDDDHGEHDDEPLWLPKSPQLGATLLYQSKGSSDLSPAVTKKVRARVRSDLLAAKRAGFKVAVLGDLNDGGFVCLSVRV